MKSILVTGGAGFIGSNFVRLLLKDPQVEVLVLDKLTYAGSLLNLEDGMSNPRLHFVKGDIKDEVLVRDLFRQHRPSGVINFAAETHVDRSIDGPAPFVETNVLGTFVLLEEARIFLAHSSSEIKGNFRFIHISTDEVFGYLGSTGRFSEDTPYAPNSPYSASKAGADHLVRAYSQTYHLPAIVTNCSNNYGPYQFPEKMIPLMILNALEAKPLPIYGDGGNIRDWIYVDDHCDGIMTVLTTGKPGHKYNIGASNEKTNLQVVDIICEILEALHPARENGEMTKAGKAKYKDLKTFVPDRPGHDRRYAMDSSKMKRDLGWNSRTTFEVGMKKTIEWYLQHIEWCSQVQENNYRRERLGLSS